MSTYVRPTVDYSTFPDTDDEPMADTEDNQALMIDTIFALRHRLEPDGHHVGGNLLVYYNPASGLDHLSPDVFVALGSGPERRKKWETWIEGKFPELIVEFASPSTSDRDVGEKIDLYSRLGVHEYYIFDPIPLLHPAFQAYHRVGRRLVPQPVGPEQRIASPVTGLVIEIVDGWLRVRDPATGELCPIPDEERAARIAAELARGRAEQRAVREEQARQEAELRAEHEEQARREAEQRAMREEQARREVEARLRAAELRAEREEQARQEVEARLRAAELRAEGAEQLVERAELLAERAGQLVERAELRAERETQARLEAELREERARLATDARLAAVEAQLRSLLKE